MTAYIYSFVVTNEDRLRSSMGTNYIIDKRVSLVSSNHQKVMRSIKKNSNYFLIHKFLPQGDNFYDFGFVESIRSPATSSSITNIVGWFRRDKQTGKITEIKKPSWWCDFVYPYSFRLKENNTCVL